MIAFYGKTSSAVPEAATAAGAPPVNQVLRPRLMRSQNGKPVSVQKWMPPAKAPGK